jgi:FkbM family methyltransferase
MGTLDGYLNKYDLRSDGFPITLHAHHLNIQNTFSLQQYGYSKNGKNIQAEAGDVVIDGGGCWGDTALYFAHRVGPAGQVICFEFVPENLEILRSNLELNPELGPRVKIAENALWDRSGDTLNFDGKGPGTSVMGDQQTAMRSVQTLSIDSLVKANGLQRVDFIKLDIEGAELQALKGAEQTIRRFRPKLAVSLYHSLDDFVEIPAYLRSLGLGYEYYLDHFTIHHEETVLFAR